MKEYYKYIIFITFVNILFFSIWCIFIKKVKAHRNKKGDCFGNKCISIGCNGDGCKAGYCIGESCQAGNCVGKECIAGDCFGFNCNPGVCQDPDCPNGTCPQTNKICTDGKAYNIKRPFYYKYTKHLPEGTMLNPPLCSPSLTIKELRKGRGRDIDIKSLNIYQKHTIPYIDIFKNGNSNIKDQDIVNYTIPNYRKNYNCQICVGKKCEF